MVLPSRMDWKRLRKLLDGGWPRPIPTRTILTDSVEAVHDAFDRCTLHVPTWIACDTEFAYDTGREESEGLLTLIGLGWFRPDGGIDGMQLEWTNRVVTSEVRRHFIRRLANLVKSVPFGTWNLKADLPVIEKNLHIGRLDHNYREYFALIDLMLMHHVQWPESPHDLEHVASIQGEFLKLKHLWRIDPLEYNWGDVIELLSVGEKLRIAHQREPRYRTSYNLKLAQVPIVLKREKEGLCVNKTKVEAMRPVYEARVDESRDLARAYGGRPLNLLSTGKDGQLAAYLRDFEGLSLNSLSKDDISVARNSFAPFDADDEKKKGITLDYVTKRVEEEGAHLLLELRAMQSQAQYVLGHYLDPLYRDGAVVDRIVPVQLIHAQASGRHSYVSANKKAYVALPLSQLPHDLRDILVPPPGRVWLHFDYDQVELRLFAVLAYDEPLLEAFNHGWDVHTLNCCDLFGLPYPPDRQDPHKSAANEAWRATVHWTGKDDPRRVFAKRFVYRLMYGGDPALAYQIPGARAIGVGDSVIVEASYRFLRVHPAIQTWQRRVADHTNRTGMSWTFMDRPRRLTDDARRGRARWSARERAGFDHPMQGGCTDIYESTIVEIDRTFGVDDWTPFAWGMHDSLNFEIEDNGARDTIARHMVAIAEQERDVYGTKVRFPVTAEIIDHEGVHHQVGGTT